MLSGKKFNYQEFNFFLHLQQDINLIALVPLESFQDLKFKLNKLRITFNLLLHKGNNTNNHCKSRSNILLNYLPKYDNV